MHFLEKLHLVGIIKTCIDDCNLHSFPLEPCGMEAVSPVNRNLPVSLTVIIICFRELVRHLFPALRVTSRNTVGRSPYLLCFRDKRQPRYLFYQGGVDHFYHHCIVPFTFCHHRGTLTDNGVNISTAHRQVCFIHLQPLPFPAFQGALGKISLRTADRVSSFCLITKIDTILISLFRRYLQCACPKQATYYNSTLKIHLSNSYLLFFFIAKIHNLFPQAQFLRTFATNFRIKQVKSKEYG